MRRLIIAATYDEQIEMITSVRADFAYLGPTPYVRAQARAKVEILAGETEAGQAFYQSALVVRSDSPVEEWRDTFRTMEKLPARIVVPGHGHPGDLAKARKDTGNYLDFLVDQVAQAARDWAPLNAVTARLANQTYIQFEGQ